MKCGFPSEQTKVICESLILEKVCMMNTEDFSNIIIQDSDIYKIIQNYKDPEKAFSLNQFFYIVCKTNNNTSIESEDLRKKFQY